MLILVEQSPYKTYTGIKYIASLEYEQVLNSDLVKRCLSAIATRARWPRHALSDKLHSEKAVIY